MRDLPRGQHLHDRIFLEPRSLSGLTRGSSHAGCRSIGQRRPLTGRERFASSARQLLFVCRPLNRQSAEGIIIIFARLQGYTDNTVIRNARAMRSERKKRGPQLDGVLVSAKAIALQTSPYDGLELRRNVRTACNERARVFLRNFSEQFEQRFTLKRGLSG